MLEQAGGQRVFHRDRAVEAPVVRYRPVPAPATTRIPLSETRSPGLATTAAVSVLRPGVSKSIGRRPEIRMDGNELSDVGRPASTTRANSTRLPNVARLLAATRA